MTAELTQVRLYGHLRARFGRGHQLAVNSPAEAVRALCAVVPGFEAYLRTHSDPGYRVFVGKTPITAEEELRHPCSTRSSIGIVPVVAGRAGAGKILAGVALIAVSFIPVLNVAVWSGVLATTWSSIAFNVGVSLVLGGVSQMLAGSPKATPSANERPENRPSYAFNGAINTSGQGNAVPVCYGGPIRVGSQVVSTALEAASL